MPFYVSSCTSEFDPITSYAENLAKLSVAPPPPTLDYETQNFYNVTLQITVSSIGKLQLFSKGSVSELRDNQRWQPYHNTLLFL